MLTWEEITDKLFKPNKIDRSGCREKIKMTLFFVTVAIGLHPSNASLYDVVQRWCHRT